MMPRLLKAVKLKDWKRHGKITIQVIARVPRKAMGYELSGMTNWVICILPIRIVPTSQISNIRNYLPTFLTLSTAASWSTSTLGATMSPFLHILISSNMKHPGIFGLKNPCAIKCWYQNGCSWLERIVDIMREGNTVGWIDCHFPNWGYKPTLVNATGTGIPMGFI